MARGILSEYGPDAAKSETPSMKKNGPVECKPLPYSPPKGPTSMSHEGPGLAGTNHGNCGTQGKR